MELKYTTVYLSLYSEGRYADTEGVSIAVVSILLVHMWAILYWLYYKTYERSVTTINDVSTPCTWDAVY